MKKFLVKYYDLHMLVTVDLNELIEFLIKEFGESIDVQFVPMNVAEQALSSKKATGVDITAIMERFWVIELFDGEEPRRRPDIEEEVVKWGRK